MGNSLFLPPSSVSATAAGKGCPQLGCKQKQKSVVVQGLVNSLSLGPSETLILRRMCCLETV